MAYEFSLPRRTIIGDNALESSESLIKSLGKKAFIVSGKNVTRIGTVKVLTDCLDNLGIEYEIFNDIIGEPTDLMIESGVKAYKNAKCDFCIAIGGGSPLDSGKAIAAMTKLEGSISDYMGKTIEGDFPPLVLIPTTAGTGSEATKFTVITDSKRNIKMLLKGEALLPDLAVIDSKFSMTSPKSVTAATGMDALTHAVEAYTSRKANSLTDTFALSAIKRIFEFLPLVYKDGDNKKAREEMAIAAYEAGVCINNSSVTLVHGMSRPIGANFHVAHGISNAMLIKECLSYVLDGSYERFGSIGRVINAADDKKSDKEAAEAFLEKLTELCNICEIPTLKEYGINKEEFNKVVDKMAQDAMNSGSPSNTIKEVKKEDLLTIYSRLW
ncbi:1,3-propanediol dehydrogenase [Clostridium beijerinckii]|jgi:alcohol dehydrogenase class IV|uniref:Iron-containing alcohol dehydrogenase n=1 Tax=Clostridium beijerinckii TaxID=1520 RepID=A0AB74VL61_CLOBE|nr:iron-containing alcohol dehydrogenase [Clostridium beijerinckii]MCI1577802.1 iron-containing alcohol dehydrogenase [Clostridium beijerinckii]MCI1584595.1 iron-containing alcohol dehydrogenase [Clostridium beijerinckii]MCI1624030.1 iron-containing alcohol dehydrogenase [Clostridium beijerinckii]NRZ26404.1 alcohol dehydrogenase class IV [Clostridium beijerinckii]NYB98916.1 alcohol dehydrogenase class IV [Clostridium beijerinckii]